MVLRAAASVGAGLGWEWWVGGCKHVVAVWTDWKASGGNFTEELGKGFGGHQDYCPRVYPSRWETGRFYRGSSRSGLPPACLQKCSHYTLGTDPCQMWGQMLSALYKYPLSLSTSPTDSD